MTPGRIVAFLILVLSLLGLLGFILPEKGIKLGNELTIRFPSPAEILSPAEQEQVDISDILDLEADADEIATPDTTAQDTLAPTLLAPLEERIALHYPQKDKSILYALFSKLEKARSQKRPVRILHYGDSQLEGDRITSYIRNKFQTQFGGSGPGLFSIADIVPSFSVERALAGDWIRYSVMTKRDPQQEHARFGALSSYSRFTPIISNRALQDTTIHSASLTITPQQNAFSKAKEFSVCKLYYGWHTAPVRIDLHQGDELISTEVVEPADKLLIREWRFPATPDQLTFTFTGRNSPDIYGISLEGTNGVNVDNIAARGGSGYEFHGVDQALLGTMYSDLDVELLILQYGGNVLPNIKNAEEAESYGSFFGAQIARFRKLIPGVSIIVIGPSDMSIKEGEDYVTRPFLENVRDAMKANALQQGAIFWDMYDAMGGKNSMVSWVNAEPPLAATDYTHFSPRGARKVGELFYSAFLNDYTLFRAQKALPLMKNDTIDVP